MNTNCCYATQDKTWTRDPDGNEWEVFVVLQDNLPETAERPQAAACCTPAATPLQNSFDEQNTVDDSACGCESAPPPAGESACCETQALKFGINNAEQSNAAACC